MLFGASRARDGVSDLRPLVILIVLFPPIIFPFLQRARAREPMSEAPLRNAGVQEPRTGCIVRGCSRSSRCCPGDVCISGPGMKLPVSESMVAPIMESITFSVNPGRPIAMGPHSGLLHAHLPYSTTSFAPFNVKWTKYKLGQRSSKLRSETPSGDSRANQSGDTRRYQGVPRGTRRS